MAAMNKYKVLGEITVIILESNKYGVKEAVIDTEKLEVVQALGVRWGVHYSPNVRNFYARGTKKDENSKVITHQLHRVVMDCPEGMVVDHINGNTLDNTLKNLRIVTKGQNLQNRRGANRNNRSGIRGVTWTEPNKKWRVKVGKRHVGMFDTLVEAEKAAKEARAKYMPFSSENSAS